MSINMIKACPQSGNEYSYSDSHQAYCPPCYNASRRIRYAQGIYKPSSDEMRNRNYKQNYGISEETYISMLELAIAGWLHAHEKSVRTHTAYKQTLEQFRRALARIGKDLDADVQTLMLVAQSFASSSIKQARASEATQNTRLAILCSFYDYAIERHLLLPMDEKGYVMNPIKIVDRAKVEPYHNIK